MQPGSLLIWKSRIRRRERSVMRGVAGVMAIRFDNDFTKQWLARKGPAKVFGKDVDARERFSDPEALAWFDRIWVQVFSELSNRPARATSTSCGARSLPVCTELPLTRVGPTSGVHVRQLPFYLPSFPIRRRATNCGLSPSTSGDLRTSLRQVRDGAS